MPTCVKFRCILSYCSLHALSCPLTDDTVEDVLLDLFIATCEFNDNDSLLLFDGLIYDFESGSTNGWSVWGQSDYELPPLAVEYEAFCGRYALEVSLTSDVCKITLLVAATVPFYVSLLSSLYLPWKQCMQHSFMD